MLTRMEKYSKKIKCIDTNKVFNSVSEASREYKIPAGNISKCCNGQRKIAGGYRWIFIDNNGQ